MAMKLFCDNCKKTEVFREDALDLNGELDRLKYWITLETEYLKYHVNVAPANNSKMENLCTACALETLAVLVELERRKN